MKSVEEKMRKKAIKRRRKTDRRKKAVPAWLMGTVMSEDKRKKPRR